MVVAKPAADKALVLRGGASLGPITPSLLTKIQGVMGLLYAVEMFGLPPAAPDPVEKYWGTPSSEVTSGILKWFGLAIIWLNGLMLYALLSLGADAVGLQKYSAFTWASCLALYLSQVSAGTPQMTEGPIIQAIMTVLSVYAGFF